MIMDLTGKTILFIGIGFYDYEKLIVTKLEDRGATVSYFSSVSNMRPVNLLYRLGFTKLALMFKNQRRCNLIRKSAKNVDIVFVIKGQELSSTDFKQLKSRNPQAKFVLYLWDSLVRHDNIDLLFENFETIYSFDRQDCANETRLKFRPLFYRDKPNDRGNRKYDLSFIGWAHSDRLAMIRKLKTQLQNAGCNFYLKLYFGPFDYLQQRYIHRTIGPKDRDIVITRPIPYDIFRKVLFDSKVVLDISHPKQSGLTMRTVETLAAGCKLLTTNNDIRNYPQINQDSIYIVDRNNPIIPTGFFKDLNNKQTFNETLSSYFYIDNFLDEILGEFAN